MSIVKSLTKKNCKEIGAEHVGANYFEGVDYRYRGYLFVQSVSRSCGTIIGIHDINFDSDAEYMLFKEVYTGNRVYGWVRELELSKVKSWMDSVVDAIEIVKRQVQTPFSEEEKAQVYQEIESTKKQVEELLKQVKKSFRWWESREDTDSILYEIQRIEDRKPDINSLLETFKSEEEGLSQRTIRDTIHARLQSIQCSIENISEINNKHN